MDEAYRDVLLKEYNEILEDDGAQELRERVATVIPERLAGTGQRLYIHNYLSSDTAGLGFALATQMAAELGQGSAHLFRAELWYPGAALVRQLIECGYLVALMGEDREEAKNWLTSSRAEILKRFTPARMRKRSVRNFRGEEYEAHCDRGGHPNPAGRVLLRGQLEGKEINPRSHWVDLAQHLGELWDTFCAALPLYDPRADDQHEFYSPHRSPEGGEEIHALLGEWRDHDRAAQRVAIPAGAASPTP